MRIDTIKYLSTGALLFLASSVCVAGVNDRISRCAESESKDARIACLEGALRDLSTEGDIPLVAESANAPHSETPVTDTMPAPVAEPLVQPTVETGPTAEIPSLPAQSDAGKASDAAVDELGAEQVEARNRTMSEDDAIVSATVVDFDFVGYRRLLVQLDNGQIWRQIDGDRTSVERGLRNEKTFDVELWSTGLGGYRMRITPLDRTIRVERLK